MLENNFHQQMSDGYYDPLNVHSKRVSVIFLALNFCFDLWRVIHDKWVVHPGSISGSWTVSKLRTLKWASVASVYVPQSKSDEMGIKILQGVPQHLHDRERTGWESVKDTRWVFVIHHVIDWSCYKDGSWNVGFPAHESWAKLVGKRYMAFG